MISVREISKSFGSVHAVDAISFELPSGQIAGLLGPNGAGKSTTIKMITGSLAPDSGSVSINGVNPKDRPAAARRQVGYLPESAPLYPEMSAEGYLRYRARLWGYSRRELAGAVGQAMERCRISDVAKRRIGHLSKGYRQRVGLAAALVHDPSVLILDEPTNGLDPSQIRSARSLIRDLAQDKTMLLCSHILPEVERTCDRVLVLAGGKIRADGTPQSLLSTAGGPVRYIVELRTNPAASPELALRALASLEGVGSAELAKDQPEDHDRGWNRAVVHAAPNAHDLREPIAGALEDRGLFVRELTRVTPSLESLFVKLIDDAGPTNPVSALEGEAS
ncbi:MAG: ABC transporter ATP-binding protein [Phycisphaerales bacterium]